ncbi:unnamed protein product, partial [Ectocarpus sp. 6 AP-2014]
SIRRRRGGSNLRHEMALTCCFCCCCGAGHHVRRGRRELLERFMKPPANRNETRRSQHETRDAIKTPSERMQWGTTEISQYSHLTWADTGEGSSTGIPR